MGAEVVGGQARVTSGRSRYEAEKKVTLTINERDTKRLQRRATQIRSASSFQGSASRS